MSADFGVDSDDGRNLFLFANFALIRRHRLSMGYGTYNDTVSGSREELDTRTTLLGYSYMSQRDFQLGAEYEHWGDEDRITTSAYSLYAAVTLNSWSVSITPQWREIDVHTSSDCRGTIDSGAMALGITYFSGDHWTFSAGYTSYNYRQNYDDLFNCVTIEELPLVVSRVQSVADDNELSIGVDYYLETETLGLNWSQIESAVDHSLTDIVSLYVTTDIFIDWSITATLGRQKNFDDSATEFIQATLGYYW